MNHSCVCQGKMWLHMSCFPHMQGLGCWMRATLCSGEVHEWDDRHLQINRHCCPGFLGQVQRFLCLGYRGVYSHPSPALPAVSQCAAEVVSPGTNRCSREQLPQTRGSSCESCRDLPDKERLWKGKNVSWKMSRSWLATFECTDAFVWQNVHIAALLNFRSLHSRFSSFVLLCSQEKAGPTRTMQTVTDGWPCSSRGRRGSCCEEPPQEVAAERRLCVPPAPPLARPANTGHRSRCPSWKRRCRSRAWSFRLLSVKLEVLGFSLSSLFPQLFQGICNFLD